MSYRQDFDLQKLKSISFDISELSIVVRGWMEKNKIGVLIKIAGQYKHGSAGKADATYIRWVYHQIFNHQKFWV